MGTDESIDTLTAHTSRLLDVCVDLKNSVAQQIADAVLISTNAAIVPLITISTNLINTQTLLITNRSI